MVSRAIARKPVAVSANIIPITDYEAFVLHVRALRSTYPDMSFSDAARRARTADPDLASRVLDSVGSWPASDPEIRALQGLPQ